MSNIQKAIEMIEPISEEGFITGNYTNGKDKCCFFGHLTRLTSRNPSDYSKDNCNAWSSRESHFEIPIEVNAAIMKHFKVDMAHINDGVIKQYSQPTPKQRVMAALKDVLAIEQAKN